MQKQSCCFPYSHVRARHFLWIYRFLKPNQFPIGQTSRNVAIDVILDIQDDVFLCTSNTTHTRRRYRKTQHKCRRYIEIRNTQHVRRRYTETQRTAHAQKIYRKTHPQESGQVVESEITGDMGGSLCMGGCLIELCVTALMP